MRQRATTAAWCLLLVAALSGVAVFVLSALAPGYYPLLRLHYWASWAIVVLGGPALLLHLWATGSERWLIGAVLLSALGLLGVPAIDGVDAPDQTALGVFVLGTVLDFFAGELEQPRHLTAPLALGVLGGVSAVLLALGLFAKPGAWRSSRWSGAAAVLVLSWASVTGVMIERAHRDSLFLAMSAHSAVGVLASVAVLEHWLASRMGRWELPRRRAVLYSGGGLLLACLLLLGVYRVEHVSGHKNRQDAARMQVAHTPLTGDERHASVTPGSDWPHLEPELLGDPMSCGPAECHPDITAEWAGSTHRYSARNRFYQAAVDELLKTHPVETAAFCANCHDPERALSGRVATDYPDGVPREGSEGVSCLVCHGMVAVRNSPASNGAFTVALPEPSGTGDEERDRANLLLDPRRHDEVFGVDPFVISPVPCRSCHRVEVGPDHGFADPVVLQTQVLDDWVPGADESFCEECHVYVVARDFDRYEHSMVGINADLAAYATGLREGDVEALAANQRAVIRQAGLVPYGPIDAPGWPPPAPRPPDSPRPGEDGPPPRALGLTMTSSLQPAPTGGEGASLGSSQPAAERASVLRVDLETVNARIGHDFPSGPLDLQEVWLELRVADATGRVLSHRGVIGPDQQILDPAARLGARELDEHGAPIQHHQVLDLRQIVDKRVIFANGYVEDRLELPLPADVAFPLDLRARWLFRRANPGFVRWALDVDASPLPAWELVGAKITVDPPGDGAHPMPL